MLENLHTHTVRCRHAFGTEREYIEAAIAAGMDTLGFSDHAPMPFQGGYYSTMRMYPEEYRGYYETLCALREEYSGKIRILIGVEAEYYPHLFDDFIRLVSEFPLDYLILGQHYLYDEIGSRYIGKERTDPADLDAFVRQSCDGMRTGRFTYLAHPDVINFKGDRALWRAGMETICRVALETGTPLELNVNGAMQGRNYPDPEFWEIAASVGNTAVLGSDAHAPETLNQPEAERFCLDLAARVGIRLLDRIPLVKPF